MSPQGFLTFGSINRFSRFFFCFCFICFLFCFFAVINLIHICVCVRFVYFCFCEVQLSCTNGLYLCSLDFKLNEKENLSCTVCLFLLLWNYSKCPWVKPALQPHSRRFPFILSCIPEETGKCIVDSTVSSLYHTIKPCAFYCILFLYACFLYASNETL